MKKTAIEKHLFHEKNYSNSMIFSYLLTDFEIYLSYFKITSYLRKGLQEKISV